MGFNQYIPANEQPTHYPLEPAFDTQISPVNGMMVHKQPTQYSPINEQFPRPMPPSQFGNAQMGDTSPLSVSQDTFQSPTQITSRMSGFHLQTPTSESSPVFSNPNGGYFNNISTYQPVTPTNGRSNIPRSNFQNQIIQPQGAQSDSMGLGNSMIESGGSNAVNNNQQLNQLHVQQQFLKQQQYMSQINSTGFIPPNPISQNICEIPEKPEDDQNNNRKLSGSYITTPTKPRKQRRTKKDSISSLEDKHSEENDVDKEITIDDLLKDDPFLELTSPTKIGDDSNDNSLISSLIDFDDVPHLQPQQNNFVGLGLDLNLELDNMLNGIPTNETNLKSNSNLSLYNKQSTPEQEILTESFKSPRKKSTSPSKSSTNNSNSPTNKVLRKSSSFGGTIPHSMSNSSVPAMPPLKNKTNFSLSECSNTFPVNSSTSNNFSFVIEKKSLSLSLSTKLRRRSLPKIISKSNERSSTKKGSSISEPSINKPSYYPPASHHQSTSSSSSSPKVLRNMKSGLILFQLQLNDNEK